jgi:uncharacterized OsmC-like protein
MREVVVSSVRGEPYRQSIEVGPHTFIVDESAGGDSAPDPYEYMLAALGACTSMTIRLYAQQKKMKLDDVSVKLHYNRDHVKDCEDCTTRRVHRIDREITLTGDLSEEDRARLLEIAERCPVHRTLVEDKEMVTTLA